MSVPPILATIANHYNFRCVLIPNFSASSLGYWVSRFKKLFFRDIQALFNHFTDIVPHLFRAKPFLVQFFLQKVRLIARISFSSKSKIRNYLWLFLIRLMQSFTKSLFSMKIHVLLSFSVKIGKNFNKIQLIKIVWLIFRVVWYFFGFVVFFFYFALNFCNNTSVMAWKS